MPAAHGRHTDPVELQMPYWPAGQTVQAGHSDAGARVSLPTKATRLAARKPAAWPTPSANEGVELPAMTKACPEGMKKELTCVPAAM